MWVDVRYRMLWKSNVSNAPRSDFSSSALMRPRRSRRRRAMSSRFSQSTPVVPKVGDTMGLLLKIASGRVITRGCGFDHNGRRTRRLMSPCAAAGRRGLASGDPCVGGGKRPSSAQIFGGIGVALVLQVVRNLDELERETVRIAEVDPPPSRERPRIHDVHVRVELDALGLEIRLGREHVVDLE